MRLFKLFYLSALLLFSVPFGCDEKHEADEITVDVDKEDVHAIMPPGGEFVLEGSTVVLETHDTSPMVHSWPTYSGVSTAGELGLGTIINYKSGERFTLPLNCNLGEISLQDYEFRLTLDTPDLLDLITCDGSNLSLHQYYPTQYDRASAFEDEPSCVEGATAGVFNISMNSDPALEGASGRINLLNILFDLNRDIPADGAWIYLEVLTFQDIEGNTACPVEGCIVYDSFFTQKFRLEEE